MHLELQAALTPVLADLEVSSGVAARVSDEEWQDAVPGAASCVVVSPGGFGMGVWISIGQPLSAQVTALADQVQEWAVEALWMLGRSASWPACEHHPGRHPLAAREVEGRALWVCPTLGAQVGEIGALTSAG